jgi:GT2 family glycosyltransferase
MYTNAMRSLPTGQVAKQHPYDHSPHLGDPMTNNAADPLVQTTQKGRISVIIPIYNVAEHVAACIHSLRSQTFTNFEALMIDDGATDGSGDIALAAAQGDPRFSLIRQENAGLSGARNTGLAQATGGYIAFVDSDDRVMPDYLMRLWQTLEETGGDWVACAIQSNDIDGSGSAHSAIHGAADLSRHVAPRRYALDTWSDVICHFPSAWNKLYRRTLIEGLRFDEGTWFEDHGFFHRAAARTDHIIHLPEALYIQTRGRAGQITGEDSDRVFEQFDVLKQMQQMFAHSPRPGGDLALARITTRLVFERSTIIGDPDRRARFASAAQEFMHTHSLAYLSDWDTDIGLSWQMEMEGLLPLSVILSWDGTDIEALGHTLEGLRQQSTPGHEVLIVCHDATAARAAQGANIPMAAHWHILTAAARGTGAGFNHGIAHARGAYVICLATGDIPTPWSLQHSVEAMLRADADFGVAQMRLHDPETDVLSYHNGMHDMTLWPLDTLPAGPLEMTPLQVLGLEAHCSAKVFRRAFLTDTGAGFTNGARPDWGLCLIAALRARRITYIAHALVTVPMHNQGFVRWGAPYGLKAMRRAHTALLETVSTQLPQVTLPKGWQRRLFARALREQVYFGKYPSRWHRLAMVSGAAALSARLGYGAPTTAGLDPSVGPRLSRMMDPLAVVTRRAPPPEANTTTHPETGKTIAVPPPDLHPFTLGTNGMVQFQAVLHTRPYANIYFYATDSHQVLFHLSLRGPENLAVCNDQHADGRWRAQRSCAVDLHTDPTTVTLTFTPPHICVQINGREVFRFGARGLRNREGFAGLDTIAGFTVEGHVTPQHIIPDIPQGALVLDSRLMLRTTADAHTSIEIQPARTPLPLIPAPQGTAAALLPARLWHDVPDGGALTLTQAHSTLTLTRVQMAARLETLLCAPLACTDNTLCLAVLEHIRHGNLLNLLSIPAQIQLAKIAKFYGATPFIETDTQHLNTPPPPLSDDPVRTQVDIAVARLTQSQSAANCPDALSVVAAMQVSPAAQQPLFLALSEYFCAQERDFAGLYDLACHQGILPLDIPPDRWSLSAALPYLAAAGEDAQIAQLLEQLVEVREDWLVTPAIGWAVRHALTSAHIPSDTYAQIFHSFAAFLRNRAPDYWDRAQCRELTRTAAALIRHSSHMPAPLQAEVMALCLEVYGLSRMFWNDLETAPDLPAQMQQAQAAYHQLITPQTPPQEREDALHLFEAAQAVDAPRVRREIFGPAGFPMPSHASLDTADLPANPAQGQAQQSQDILRHMASPNSSDVTPAVAVRATDALPALYPETPRAPDLGHQQATTTRAVAWLRDPNADITALTDALAQLAGADAHHLGMGMALALIDTVQETAHAQELCTWLHLQSEQHDPASWRIAPAVVTPAHRLHSNSPQLPCVQTLLDALALPDLPIPPAGATDQPEGAPLFDTIVTVFSCAQYLDTRIPALRAGWLSLLKDLGVPYVVVIGNGDGTRHGDIVHLDAPDDYEGLPQKTLATIAWVHDNTRFGHMLKIDDDCFLNAELFFKSLSYAKFDYYGRRLHRVPGQTDRIWHQTKSSTPRGQMDLDKSPEPSEYADGGSAYTLSRTAMAAALDAARSPEGQQLIDVSFMEDKMLGDLLAMRGIYVAQEDYRVSIRRRTWRDALPVASWLNSFHASAIAPLQLVHLDTHLDQAAAVKRLNTPTLSPQKIWPSYQDVKLGYDSNALELISTQASVQAACDADVAVVACMRNEMFMLPQFLAHYRKLGVRAFLIADNCSDDGTLEYLVQQPDVALFSVDTDYSSSHYGVAWQQAMMAAFRVGKWSLVADADELLVWQENQTQTLPDLLQEADFKDADAVRLFMLDMYPKGSLEEADFTHVTPFDQAGFADRIPFVTSTMTRGPNSSQSCWTSALRHRLIPGSRPNLFVAQKLALLRYHPAMRLSAGLHFVGDVQIAPRELLLAHFKYNADFYRKAQAEVLRGQHFNDAEEYRKYLAMAAEGRSVIYDPDLSVPWAQVPFVKRRLKP